MRVGIVTFHRAHNFGAVLQCLALKAIVKDLGYDVCIVDHRNKKIEKYYKLHNPLNFKYGLLYCIKSSVNFLLTLIPKLNRIKKFKSFIDNYLIDSTIKTDSINSLDYIIYGSDQIWRGRLTGDDLFYWGEYNNTDVKKISYAASAGLIDESVDKNIELLKSFSSISVRENDLRDFLVSKGIDAQISIDPTLLLDKDRWSQILPIKSIHNKPYILVYSMRNRKKVRNVAEIISKKENIPVKEIFNNNISWREVLEPYNSGDPIDFLSLIKSAAYVVTDSFHGTAFAVIFNKQFVTVELNDGHDNRARSLLSSIGIADRMSEDGSNYELVIDYSKVNFKINNLKEESIKYLKRALNSNNISLI